MQARLAGPNQPATELELIADFACDCLSEIQAFFLNNTEQLLCVIRLLCLMLASINIQLMSGVSRPHGNHNKSSKDAHLYGSD